MISSNREIRDLVRRNINAFLELREEILQNPRTKALKVFDEPQQSENVANLCLKQLRLCVSSDKTSLVFCGENCSGKTTFIHLFLGIRKILPSDDGPVTSRITKLTYAPAEHACVRVYKNVRDRTLPELEISLAPFFASHNPDRAGIARVLLKHVTRPEGMDEKSEEFDRWARCLVEIHLPSPILAQGIDVYDTPGFLIGDAPVLTENLHDLVELIHPTIVFMYGNPSTDDGTKSCFVAMKAALHDIDRTSIFFLNSKADVNTMLTNGTRKHEQTTSSPLSWPKNERERYELLLRAPFLSDYYSGRSSSIDRSVQLFRYL